MKSRPTLDRPAAELGAVARAQLRLVAGRPKRGVAIGLALALAQIVALAAFGIVFGIHITIGQEETVVQFSRVADFQEELEYPLDEGATAVLVAFACQLICGLFWPFHVWREETPGRRGYHWAMPVDRRTHDLVRVAVGALGLAAIGALLYGAALATALASGHAAGLGQFSLPFWLCLALAPLVPYAYASILTVRCQDPGAWLWGGAGAVLGLWALAAMLDLDAVQTVLYQVFAGPLGLARAAAGPVYDEIFHRGAAAGGPWLLAWAVWLALLAGGVVLAASTRPRSS